MIIFSVSGHWIKEVIDEMLNLGICDALRERERERERERQRQRQRQRQTETDRDRQRQTEPETERETERETETDRETERQRDRQTERESHYFPFLSLSSYGFLLLLYSEFQLDFNTDIKQTCTTLVDRICVKINLFSLAKDWDGGSQ